MVKAAYSLQFGECGTLENAMLTAFGQDSSELFHQIMLAATGAAVVCTVQGIAVYMIRNAGKYLKAIHNS